MSWGFRAQHPREENIRKHSDENTDDENEAAGSGCQLPPQFMFMLEKGGNGADYSDFCLRWNMNSSGCSWLLDSRLKLNNGSSSQIKVGLDPMQRPPRACRAPPARSHAAELRLRGGSISSSLFPTVFQDQSRLMVVFCFIIHAH